jgi:hypothetical protein
MFKSWLKSSKKVLIIGSGPVGTTIARNYPKEVLEIHNEFNTAADKLVEEANSILKKHESLDKVKVERLLNLGFKKAQQVEEGYKAIKEIKMSKEQIDLLNYYKKEYPLNKFITEEQVKIICHKYNLVCGDVTRFKGFVPEKNLREIERFKLKSKDENPDRSLCTWGENEGKMFNDKGDAGRRYSGIYKLLKGTSVLEICAPVKDMDTSGLRIEDGYRLVKHVPDPVVLQPVNGGYLILTAWGDEASDPLVVNEINN